MKKHNKKKKNRKEKKNKPGHPKWINIHDYDGFQAKVVVFGGFAQMLTDGRTFRVARTHLRKKTTSPGK